MQLNFLHTMLKLSFPTVAKRKSSRSPCTWTLYQICRHVNTLVSAALNWLKTAEWKCYFLCALKTRNKYNDADDILSLQTSWQMLCKPATGKVMADLKQRVFRVKIRFFFYFLLWISLKFLLWVDINAEWLTVICKKDAFPATLRLLRRTGAETEYIASAFHICNDYMAVQTWRHCNPASENIWGDSQVFFVSVCFGEITLKDDTHLSLQARVRSRRLGCTCAGASVCVRLWLRLLVFVIHPALLRALFQCHGILLDECITSPGSHHVCTCLYMFGGLASIFGRGQLLSSVALPEGRTPTALHRWLIWGGSAACHSLARTSWSLPAWLCWKDKAHCRVDLEKHMGVASIGKGLGVFIISTNPFQTGKRGQKFYLRECSGVFVCSRI